MITLLNIAYFFVVCIVLCLIGFVATWWNPQYIIADSDETRCSSPGLSPTRFPEQNHIVGQGKHPAKQVPARIDMTETGHMMTTCWKFTLRDRLKVLLTGRLWASTWVFGEDRPRPYFSVDKADVLPTQSRPRRVY